MDTDVLFYLPVTKDWLFQLILALVLICHASYRGFVELFRDLLDVSISVGTIHYQRQVTSVKATEINQSQALSSIQGGLHDEIYQSSQLVVLTGVDAASTYCYLLEGVEKRDEDTWGCYLLDTQAQGFNPDCIIADGGQALRARQRAVIPDVPCHGDVCHIQHEFETIVNTLTRQAKGATNRTNQAGTIDCESKVDQSSDSVTKCFVDPG